MGHLSSESRLRELGYSAWRKLRGDLRVASQYLNEGYKKVEDRLFSRVCCDGTRRNDFKIEERKFRLDIKKSFYNKGREALAQSAQRAGGCPIPRDTQGQPGWGSEPLLKL